MSKINFTHTVELFHSHIHPDGVEITYDCEGEFEAQYDDENVYTGSTFGLTSISRNGVQLPAFGASRDWRVFLDAVEDSARRAVEFERVRIELSDRVGDISVVVIDELKLAA